MRKFPVQKRKPCLVVEAGVEMCLEDSWSRSDWPDAIPVVDQKLLRVGTIAVGFGWVSPSMPGVRLPLGRFLVISAWGAYMDQAVCKAPYMCISLTLYNFGYNYYLYLPRRKPSLKDLQQLT